MDILEKSSIEITSLAMDGLAARHKALSSNIANADTPNYRRIDVSFEAQLEKILSTEKAKEYKIPIESVNTGSSFGASGSSSAPSGTGKSSSDQKSLVYSDFKPQTFLTPEGSLNSNGNNVNIEQEMAELAKNGMQYNALAQMQAKSFGIISETIKGGGAA